MNKLSKKSWNFFRPPDVFSDTCGGTYKGWCVKLKDQSCGFVFHDYAKLTQKQKKLFTGDLTCQKPTPCFEYYTVRVTAHEAKKNLFWGTKLFVKMIPESGRYYPGKL